MPRVWFVTGTSQGIGRCIVEHVLRRGDIVVATLRTPSALSTLAEQYPSSQLLVLKCDVTDYAEVKEAFEQALRIFKRIDIVVNNAGIGLVGEAEGTPEDIARKMFDVNFWSAANVSREAVRIFREINAEDEAGPGGKLINISSTAGIVGNPCVTYYCASKFALEGFTEALQKEVDPRWNISVTIVELGAFRTGGAQNSANFPVHPAYTDPGSPSQWMRGFFNGLASGSLNIGDPNLAAEKIFELVGLEKPPLRIALGARTVEHTIQKLDAVKQDLQTYASWSEGL